MKIETYNMPSTNKVNQLHTLVWRPQGEVQAILQISHGMIEHIGRYDDFAKYLAERNILVVGNDHLGHGRTAQNEKELGYFDGVEGSRKVVDDLYEVTKNIKAEYPKVPYFVLGHSMGSFMIRRYIMTYGKSIDGAIIMGTGHQTSVALAGGYVLYAMIKAVKGDAYHSKLLSKISMGSYNKAFTPNRTTHDWLSRDTQQVDAYLKDPYCQFSFTLNGFKTIFDTFSYINKRVHIKNIPSELPIFFVAGDKDPVGNNGKAVTKVFRQYKEMGIKDIKLKLYPESRHEILNDLDHLQAYEDIYSWLKAHM